MATNKNASMQYQLEENGVVLDSKWAFNPVSVYKPKRKKLKMFFQNLDSMQFCNRFKWVGIPLTIPAELIEQMLYHRGALVFYKQGKEFRLLPFVSTGKMEMYGLMNKVQPIAYNGAKASDTNIGQEVFINQFEQKDKLKGVILYDRFNGFISTGGLEPTIAHQETIIEEIVNRLCFLNINLVNSQGKNIILVKDPKQKASVEKALNNIYASDKAFALVKSMFEVQVINNGIEYEEQGLWEDITSWNNLRLEGLGITNSGLFNKKEREITIESDTDSAQTETISDAYFEARKFFVKKVKEVFADDPDFKEQFKGFNCIDLRLENKKEKTKEQQDEEGGDESDNFMF